MNGQRRRIIWGLLLWLMCNVVVAQESEISITAFKERKQQYWRIRATVPAPDNTRVKLRLLFADEQLPASYRRLYVRKGKIFCNYGPLKGRILSGTYRLEMQLPGKTPNYHDFYMGSRAQERKDRHRYSRLFFELTEKLPTFHIAETEYYLHKEPPVPAQELQYWLRSAWKHYRYLTQKLQKYLPPQVFVPYSRKSLLELRDMIVYTDWLLKYRLAKVFRRHDLPIPKEYPQSTVPDIDQAQFQKMQDFAVKNPNSPQTQKMLAQLTQMSMKAIDPVAERANDYEMRVREIAQQIRKREPVPSNLLHDDLENDALWLKKLYHQANKLYRKMRNRFVDAEWSIESKLLLQELDDFTLRSGDYKKSPLATRHPRLVLHLDDICSNMRRLILSYGYLMYRKHRLPIARGKRVKTPPKRLCKLLQKTFALLDAIVKRENNNLLEERRSLRQKIAANLKSLRKLYREIQAQDSFERDSAWKTTWQASWRKRLQKLSVLALTDSEQITTHFPKINRAYQRATIELNAVYRQAKSVYNGDNSAQRLAKLEQHKYWFLKWIYWMESRLRKP